MHAIRRGEDCFLTQPEWIRLLERPLGRSHYYLQGRRMFRMLIYWPSLLRRMRIRRHCPDDVANLEALTQSLERIEALLADIGTTVENYRHDTNMVVTVPSKDPKSPLEMVYEYIEPNFAYFVTSHAAGSIIINKMIATIALAHSPVIAQTKEAENAELAQRIWMSIAWAAGRKPFGPRGVLSAVSVSIAYACTAEMRDWLVDMVNDLKTLPGGVRPTVTLNQLRAQSLVSFGLADDPQPGFAHAPVHRPAKEASSEIQRVMPLRRSAEKEEEEALRDDEDRLAARAGNLLPW